MKKNIINYVPSIIVLAAFLIFSPVASGQRLVQVGEKFFFDSKIYSMKQVDSIFALSPNAYTEFLAFKKSRSKEKDCLIYTGIFSVSTLGVYLLIQDNKKETNIIGAFLLIPVQIGLVGLGTLTSLGAIISFSKYSTNKNDANNHLKKAINFINKDFGSIEKEKEPIIGFGFIGNGFGLSYSF